jgi:hypothetical protein
MPVGRKNWACNIRVNRIDISGVQYFARVREEVPQIPIYVWCITHHSCRTLGAGPGIIVGCFPAQECFILI